MSSLRTRLFIALVAVGTLAGAASGLVIYWWMYGEAIELQDGLIVQVGAFLAERPGRPDLIPNQDVDSDARLSVAELGEAPSVDGSPLAYVSKEIADGLHTLDLEGKTWRVLLQTRRDGSRIVVGQPIEARDEVTRWSAIHAVASFAALIPCLMVLIALVIHYSFRPVSGLAEKLDRDRDGTPSRLPDKDLPDELRPFILAINSLIGRLADQLDRERRFIADAAPHSGADGSSAESGECAERSGPNKAGERTEDRPSSDRASPGSTTRPRQIRGVGEFERDCRH